MTLKRNEKIIAILVIIIAIIPIIIFSKNLSSINEDGATEIKVVPETNNIVSPIANMAGENNALSIEDEAERKYIDESKFIMKDFNDSLNYLSQLLDEKPLYITWNETEKAVGALSSATIEQTYDRATKLKSPAKFLATHDLWLQSLKKYEKAMPLFRQGMDDLDSQKIHQATILMTEGATLLRQATAKMSQ